MENININIDNYKHMEFDSKAVLRFELGKILSQVADLGDYNLYVHKIYDFDEWGKNINNQNTVLKNMEGIIKSGLSISKYPSMTDTSSHIGIISPDKVDDILNYDYPWPVPQQAIVILAVPKYIDINGEKIDFTTPEYSGQYKHAYDQCDFNAIHTAFTLGTVIVNRPDQTEEQFLTEGNKYQLYLNQKHYSILKSEEQLEVMGPIKDRVEKNNGILDTDNKQQIEGKIRRGIIEKNREDYNLHTHAGFWDFD